MASIFNPISGQEKSITPFKAHKNWKFDESNYTSSYGATILVGHCTSSEKIPIGDPLASNYPTNLDGSYQKVIYYSMDHLFYNKPNESYGTLGAYNRNASKRSLNERINVFNVPQKIYNEKIKNGSVNLTDYSRSGSYGDISSIYLYDDGQENLIDNTVNSSSFVNSSNLVAYWGFNEFYIDRGKYRNGYIHSAKDGSKNDIQAYLNKIEFSDGIQTSGAVTDRSGIKADFNDISSSIVVYNDKKINFKKDDNFAISFWPEFPISQSYSSGNTSALIYKNGAPTNPFQYTPPANNSSLPIAQLVASVAQQVNQYLGAYPYKIFMYNEKAADHFRGKIAFSRSDTNNTCVVTSSVAASGKHVICQKSGSYIQIYLDGALDTEIEDTITGDIHNEGDLWMGKNPIGSEIYSGSLDEVRIYSGSLSDSDILSLSNNHYISSSAYQTNVAGNVFYSTGFVTVTSPLPKYKYVLTGQTGTFDYGGTGQYGFSLNMKAQKTIVENKIICRIKTSDYNISSNPTLRKPNSWNDSELKDVVTSSYFDPYITTVGLYDNEGDLLAIGKLANPLRKREDINLNVVVKWDT